MDSATEQAFRDYVISRRDILLREAFLMVGDVHLAEDLVQTTLAKAYVAWHRVAASELPDAYVRRILVNSNLSRVRRHRVREVLTQLPPDRAWAGSDPGDRLDLLQALLSLPRRQRAVVVLRYWADLPEVEVARIMCCSVGTVRSQAYRALAKLRVLPDLQSLAPKEGSARWANTKTVN